MELTIRALTIEEAAMVRSRLAMEIDDGRRSGDEALPQSRLNAADSRTSIVALNR